MKKLYFLLVALLISFSASAKGWYINGNFNSWKSWTETALADYKLTETSSGIYEIDLTQTSTPDLSSGFLVVEIDSSTPNWTSGKIGGATIAAVDTEYSYTIGGGDITCAKTFSNATVIVNTNTKKIKVTTAGSSDSGNDSGSATDEYSQLAAIDGVYLKNTAGWSAPTVWAWGSSNSTAKGSWPGDAMTKDGDYWVWTVPSGKSTPTGIIFSNNGSSQTSDLTYTASGVYDNSGTLLGIASGSSEGNEGGSSGDDNQGGDTGDDSSSSDYSNVYVNVIGDFNEWKDNGLNPDADGITKHEGLAIGTYGFKVKTWDGSADAYWSTGGSLTAGQWITIDGDATENMTIAGATESSVYDVEFNFVSHSIRVTLVSTEEGGDEGEGGDDNQGGDEGDNTGDVDYSNVYVNVIGDFNEWKDNGLNPDADGITKHEGLAIGTYGFKVKTWDGSADAYWSTGGSLTVGEWIPIDGDATANMTIAGATESSVYDVEFNYVSHSIRVTLVSTEEGGDEGEGGDDNQGELGDMWILGNLGDYGWGDTPGTGVQMTKDGNIYTAEKVDFILPSTSSTVCYFNLTDYVGSTWDDLNAGANRYGAATEGEAITVNKAATVVKYANNVSASGCLSWTVEPGTYNVVFDSDAMTLTLTATTGIDAIEAGENADAIYYNLQGVRVNNPSNGMYIVVRGNKVAKEIVK